MQGYTWHSGVHCTVYGVQYIIYNVHCTLYSVYCTVYSVQCTGTTILCTINYMYMLVYSYVCVCVYVHVCVYKLYKYKYTATNICKYMIPLSLMYIYIMYKVIRIVCLATHVKSSYFVRLMTYDTRRTTNNVRRTSYVA